MTDGILLAELQRDRDLRTYDTIIIDEAHERSLNIDFLLGYLKRLLPRRPDLKLIITSATIDPQRFAEHFADRRGNPAPIIEVSGRTYPVDVRYRPLVERPEEDEEGETIVRDQTEAIVDAVAELAAEGPGDILVFLPGEREIRDTAEVLAGARERDEIVPLYSRLSAAEQHRVFASHTGRRIVLATNVAETSLTVPGIRYVVDSGVARISRYSARTKVQRLPIEAISQASAQQRSGRCGRVEAGIAIRLYSEEDFESRPLFTDPEILRTNLASVILQMTSLRLGEIARFPFVEPPDKRTITDGVQLLEELGAIGLVTGAGAPSSTNGRMRLTKVGQRLARLPIDPRLGRMILEAERLGVLRDVLVIAAVLSLQDPRERPVEQRQQADQQHARFTDKTSDFLTWLNLWRYLREQQRELSGSAFRRMCKREHLNYLRVREWQDFESQLRQVCKEMGIQIGKPAEGVDSDGIHQALLAGLLSHIGLLEERDRKERGPREYLGARNSRFAIFPGQLSERRQPDVPDGRRARRDRPALGAAERRDQAGVGREGRRAPREAHLLRAALVEEARGRDGLRARHPLRRPAGRGPAHPVRPDRPGAEPGDVHPPCPRVRRVVDAPEVLPREPPIAGGGRGARAPRPPPGPRRRRAHPVRLLRHADRPRGRQRGALRHVVEAGAAYEPRPADVRPGDAHPRDRRRGTRGGLPADMGGGGADVPDLLRLPARHTGGRPDDRRPGRDAQPGRGRRLLVERPRPARGAGHQPAAQPAQEPAGLLRPRAQHGQGLPRPRAGRRRGAARRTGALPALDHRRGRAARRLGLGEGAGAPPADLPGRRRRRLRAGPREGPRGAQGPAPAGVRRCPRGGRLGRGAVGDRADDLDLRHGRGVGRPAAGRATRCGGTPPSSTRARRSGWGCSARPTRPRPATGSASDACSCWGCGPSTR